MENIRHKLENIDIEIDELQNIYDTYKDDKEIVNLIAMNLSLRTSIKNKSNENCSKLSQILTNLAASSDMATRWSVAKNPCTPIEVLETLAQDKINLVRALVATNPTTPQDILIHFFNDEKIVRDGLSGNPSTPSKYLHVLADDKDKMVRLRVASNPTTSKQTLEKLTKDKDKNVCIKAKKELQKYETTKV
jgi:hypothetical protein